MAQDKVTRKPRTQEVTHKIMSAIPSKDTRPEIALRKALWHKNLRYRVNYKKLPGKPDIVFTKQMVAVFCDGDYWHGPFVVLRRLRKNSPDTRTIGKRKSCETLNVMKRTTRH